MFTRALYIQSDLKKDTENWFNVLQKALSVSQLCRLCISFEEIIFQQIDTLLCYASLLRKAYYKVEVLPHFQLVKLTLSRVTTPP